MGVVLNNSLLKAQVMDSVVYGSYVICKASKDPDVTEEKGMSTLLHWPADWLPIWAGTTAVV